MRGPAGLDAFARAFPDRVFDVGIAEQHAVTSAAGMAMGGLHPIVAVYATFLSRAFDQLMMDCALHRLPVTFVLDRAGITGPDGPSHHGMWDLSLAGLVPGLRVAAPRDAATLAEELDEAMAIGDGPTMLRWPKGPVPEPVPAIRRVGPLDVLAEPAGRRRSRVRPGVVGGRRRARRNGRRRGEKTGRSRDLGDGGRPPMGASGIRRAGRAGPPARVGHHRRGRRPRRRSGVGDRGCACPAWGSGQGDRAPARVPPGRIAGCAAG